MKTESEDQPVSVKMSSEASSSTENSDIEGAVCQNTSPEKMVNNSATKNENNTKPDSDFTAGTSNDGAETTCLDTGMDRLLQRHRAEIMYELRRIQNGERPVTGQNNRQTLENFFRHAREAPISSAQELGIRPETVVVEVQGLVQSRPVTLALQSSSFRRRLENTIRSSLGQLPTGPQSSSRASTPSAVIRNTRTAVSRENQTPPSASSLGNRDNIAAASEESEHQGNNTESWVEQQQSPVPLNQPVAIQWDTVENAHRDAMVFEISELVHQHLVTSALEGNTRNRLEAHIQRRAEQTGANGTRIQEVLQTLPRGRIQRNDFSHLGIIPGQGDADSDNLDNISVISATAAVHVPYTQSNAAMNQEIRSLKVQMQELKQMIKMNFDLQLDVQRAIRQEVAAAMSNVNQGASTSSGVPSRPLNDSQCLICLDKSADSVLYQCGHVCVCYGCGMELKARNAHCPVCRAPIKDIIRAYKC